MANIIRCPHVIEVLNRSEPVQGFVAEDSSYVELCNDCCYKMLDELIPDMPREDVIAVMKRALHNG